MFIIRMRDCMFSEKQSPRRNAVDRSSEAGEKRGNFEHTIKQFCKSSACVLRQLIYIFQIKSYAVKWRVIHQTSLPPPPPPTCHSSSYSTLASPMLSATLATPDVGRRDRMRPFQSHSLRPANRIVSRISSCCC